MCVVTIYKYIPEQDTLACTLYKENHYTLYFIPCTEMNFLYYLLSLFPSKFTVNTLTRSKVFRNSLGGKVDPRDKALDKHILF